MVRGNPIVAPYRHRVLGTPKTDRIGSSSAWRTGFIDRIDCRDTAHISIVQTATASPADVRFPSSGFPTKRYALLSREAGSWQAATRERISSTRVSGSGPRAAAATFSAR